MLFRPVQAQKLSRRDRASGRICFFVRAMEGGGAQRDAILLANGIQAAGIPAAIVTLDANGPLADLIDPAVSLVDLGKGRRKRMALAIPTLVKLLHHGGATAFVSSEAGANCLTIAASGLVPKSRRPLIILREVASPSQARRSDPYRQNRFGYALAPWLYPLADGVVTFTAGVFADLRDNFRVPQARLANLGTNAVLTEQQLAAIIAMPRHIEPNLIAAVGRLSPEKDHATLIAALAIVRRSVAAHLVIAGEGSQRTRLLAQIGALGLDDAVSLTGFMPDPFRLLSHAALFVCSSRHEGFGNALVEALAMGVPVVSTNAPHGPQEILDGGRWGALVPVGDPEALAVAMLNALRHPADPTPLRARAADFTVEKAVARFIQVLADFGLPLSRP